MNKFSYSRKRAASKIQAAIRGRQARRKSTFTSNKSAKSQASQIYNNSKQINKLYKKIRNDGRDYFNYYNNYSEAIPKNTGTSSLGYGYTMLRMVNTSNWQPCLDIPSDEQTASGQWKLLKSQIQLRIELAENYYDPAKFTVIHFKIKPHMYDIATRNWGSSLNDFFTPALPGSATPVSINPNPIFVGITGQTWINKSYFQILNIDTFMLGARQMSSPPAPEGPNTTHNLSDSVRELYYKQSYGKNGCKLFRGRPDIQEALDTSSTALNRDAQTYILIVADTVSSEPALVTASVLHTLCTK